MPFGRTAGWQLPALSARPAAAAVAATTARRLMSVWILLLDLARLPLQIRALVERDVRDTNGGQHDPVPYGYLTGMGL